jgi:magnesium transporter
MEPTHGRIDVTFTVQQAIDFARAQAENDIVFPYAYVVDEQEILVGVVVMRDLLFADRETPVTSVMIEQPFCFTPDTTVQNAMLDVVHRHYPVYPVCDENGILLGVVQGFELFEEHAIEVSAQSGRMVGVDNEEHLSTPIYTCLKYRHPWLQLNLATAFMAAFVVGFFENTIHQIVVLAAFLPVLAGQSGNTGCQALAVTLRGMTLGELKRGQERTIIYKELMLGTMNGALVGITAGLGMFAYAMISGSDSAIMLSMVVFFAMLGSCIASGVTGVLVPVALKRLGADPATASTIFLTTATDILSMGLLLGLATMLLL